jgi:molybdopterin-binding protein
MNFMPSSLDNRAAANRSGLDRSADENQFVWAGYRFQSQRQVRLSICGQHITSIVSADAVREVRFKPGGMAIALIKSIEVMIVQFG